MKALVIAIGLIALGGISWAHVSVEQEAAISGCCKQKVGDYWRRIGDDFESCKELNEPDGDNVFEQNGTYWWDVSC
jgi:hypothetical protein